VNSPDDNQLMLQIRNGDVDKLSLLFERHHVALYNFFLRMTGKKEISEDMVQDVFFRMLKYRHTYRGDGKFSNWMFHIARNVQFDYFKKKQRQDFRDFDELELISDNPTPGEAAEQNQDNELIHSALMKLAVEKREVLVLSRFQNKKYEEIAEMLDCKVGTIKARVFRAIKDLREIYFQLSGELI
jgi:RNA polymerase sigma factor (sigma-70 family)